ncbi:MAG: polysaccharide biosynthesis/export family protein [Acidobacteriota bacterium]
MTLKTQLTRSLDVSFLVACLATTGLFGQVNEVPTKTAYRYTRPDRIMTSESSFRVSLERLPGITPEYRIGPGDLLSVKIVGIDNMDQEVRVSASGKISLPYLGVLDAADITASELEAKIARLMVENQLMREPEVLIFVTEYRAKPVYILGEVDRAGEIFMSQELYLMDAILMAGGLDYTASDHAFLHRRKLDAAPPSPSQFANAPGQADASDIEVIEIDLRPIKEGGIVNPNPLLRKGDVLFIPERKTKHYYMIGELEKTGMFQLPGEGDLLVSRAISTAGGPLKTARMAEGVMVRYDQNGVRQEQKVDFKAILEGRAPDFKVQPDDLIFIPGSQFKTWGYALLGFVPRMAYLGAALIP